MVFHRARHLNSQDSRTLLDQVCLAKFGASEVNMYFKRSFDEEEYKFADFLMKKFKFISLGNRE